MRTRTVVGMLAALVGKRRVLTQAICLAGACVIASVAAISDARAQPAQARTYTIQSRILGEQRRIRVALPANFAIARQRYPVIYLLDGHVRAFFDLTVAAASYDLLGDVRDFAIPGHIVVAVEHKSRGTDLGSNADAFMRHLTDELAPYIERQFRAHPYRILVGHSLGGRFALMASCRAPGFFSAIIAVSPGGGDSTAFRATTDCLKSDWRAHAGSHRQIFINSGEREQRIDVGAKRLRDFLRDSAPPSVRWRYAEGPDLAHTETPYAGIPAGIKFIYDRALWEMPRSRADSVLEANGDPDAIIAAWYFELGARLGYAVPTSAKWLDAAANAHTARREPAAAERTSRRLVAEYPEDIRGYGRLADVLIRSGQSAAARRVLDDAVRMIDKLDFFDEMDRALKRKVLTDALTGLSGGRP